MSKPTERRTAVKNKHRRTHMYYKHIVPEGTTVSEYMVGLMVQPAPAPRVAEKDNG